MVLPAPAILLLLIVCGTNKCIDVNDHDIILDVSWVTNFLLQECNFFPYLIKLYSNVIYLERIL